MVGVVREELRLEIICAVLLTCMRPWVQVSALIGKEESIDEERRKWKRRKRKELSSTFKAVFFV